MEVTENQLPWLDQRHPNFSRWKRAREISIERGKFVKSILGKVVDCNSLKILDLGSGEGGTSKVLAENNDVVSFDISKERLRRQSESTENLERLCGSALDLPFNKNSFDIVILQDVIEHLPEKDNFPETIHHLLKDEGIVYLSTPNKFSIFNFLSDPHWGVPVISILSRKKIKKYFLRYFRESEVTRKDIAELNSLNDLYKLFDEKFKLQLYTKYSVKELFNGNKGIVWSNFHLRLVRMITFFKLNKILIKITNDKPGLLNRFFTPTFYLILKKK
ncbi:class I SAM-dependent methyltransferase [bacterium BMS3Abin03]|nr:class I SAM-dependent methyltransferase [bacterium BMS3Abin03]